MEIIFLGTGTAIPSKQRRCVGIFLQTNASKIVLDMGSGTLGRMAEAGIDWRKIDAVFISHFHPDHCLDLFAYLFASIAS